MKRILWIAGSLAAMAMPGCGGADQAAEKVGQCVGGPIGQAIGAGIGSSLQGALGPYGDWAVRGAPDSGVTLNLSARHAGGRLWITFAGPVTSGTLPRYPVPNDCTTFDSLDYRDNADGELHPVSGTVSINDGGQPGDQDIDLSVAFAPVPLADGGSSLPPPDFHAVLPIQ